MKKTRLAVQILVAVAVIALLLVGYLVIVARPKGGSAGNMVPQPTPTATLSPTPAPYPSPEPTPKPIAEPTPEPTETPEPTPLPEPKAPTEPPTPRPQPTPSPQPPLAPSGSFSYANHLPAPEQKTVYLTFDDGPTAYTHKVLDVLAQYGVKATFFVVGNQVDKNPDIVRRIAAEGHVLGNHTYDHTYSVVYANRASFTSQLERTEAALLAAVGPNGFDNRLFRMPGGHSTAREPFIDLAHEMGYSMFLWNALSDDAVGNTSVEGQKQRLKTTIGSKHSVVVLQHDASSSHRSAEVLPWLIEYLTGQGYSFGVLHSTAYLERLSPPTPEPITPEPITPEPITPEPVTPEPITPEPVTPAPTESDMVTDAP